MKCNASFEITSEIGHHVLVCVQICIPHVTGCILRDCTIGIQLKPLLSSYLLISSSYHFQSLEPLVSLFCVLNRIDQLQNSKMCLLLPLQTEPCPFCSVCHWFHPPNRAESGHKRMNDHTQKEWKRVVITLCLQGKCTLSMLRLGGEFQWKDAEVCTDNKINRLFGSSISQSQIEHFVDFHTMTTIKIGHL